MWELSTITDVGENLLASWITGATLNLTRAEGGSGKSGSKEALYALTAPLAAKQQMSIVAYSRESKYVTVSYSAEPQTRPSP